MIELIKEFLLFGVIEVFILMMFYRYIGNIKEVKWWHGVPLCTIFFFVGLINLPFVKQIGMIVVMALYLFVLTKRLNIKYVVLSSLYLICVESSIALLLNLFINIDITNLTLYKKFITMIPIRFIELFLIIFYDRRNIWVGCGGAMSQK